MIPNISPSQLSGPTGADDDAPSSLPRRGFLRTSPAIAAALALPGAASFAQMAERWVATWGAAPAAPPSDAILTLSNQTLRLIVHASVGGSRARIRISNDMGSATLSIGAARIALRSSGATLVAGTDRPLLFGGRGAVAIPAGAAMLSDPVSFNVPPFADLAVSLYLPSWTRVATQHNAAMQTGYVSTAGNQAANASLAISRSIGTWPFLTEVDVSGAYSGLSASNAVVAFGDSLTDGQASGANANRRWPDQLARRLQLEGGVSGNTGVANRGISANSLLTEYAGSMWAGQKGLTRFDRDVLGTSGVRWVIVLIGINDIIYGAVSSDSLINGHLQLASRARAAGLRPIGGTLAPFEGAASWTSSKEAVRSRINAWMRSSGAYDAVVDFDRALRDPARPTRMLATYDSGDRLHPNPGGYQAMAQAVPLSLFTQA